jgi:flagellar hook-length control protein FliK
VSSVVGESSTSFPSQSVKPKAGASGQSSNGNGFSGLVDSNLAAAAEDEIGPAPTKPKAASPGATQQPNKPATGVYKKASEPDQTTHPPDKTAQPAQDATVDATVAVETVVKVGVIAKASTFEAAEPGPEAGSEGDPATAVANVDPAPTVTGIIPAVAMQIEFAVEAPQESVIDSGDAIPVTNPAATIVTPAGTAANALAKVAADTGDAEDDGKPAMNADVELPSATASEAKTPAETKAETEIATLAETAAAEVQIEVKAKAELSSAVKVIDLQSVATLAATKPEAPKADPLSAPKSATASQEPVAPAKPETSAKPAVEAKEQTGAPDKPAEAETRAAPRPAQEHTVHPAAHGQANAEPPQPNGVGLTQVAALHIPNAALQSAAFTAIAATAGVPVPISGLAVEIAANVQIGRSRFEIRLDPPELGRIDVRLDVDKQGQVTSHLIVEKPTTLDLLRRDAQQLERALQDAGLKTGDNGLQFSLRDQQQSGRNNDDESQRNAQRLIVTEEEATAVETAGRSYGRMIGQRGGIDIRV